MKLMSLGCEKMIKLSLEAKKEYGKSAWSETYKCDFDSIEDIFLLIHELSTEYGEMQDFCYMKVSNGKELVFYEDFEDFIEFQNGFTYEKMALSGCISFSCKERYVSFIINLKDACLFISCSEAFLGKKKHRPMEYYRTLFWGIVKYDPNRGMLYSYDEQKNEWIRRRDLIRSFNSYDMDEYYLRIDEEYLFQNKDNETLEKSETK